MSYLIYVSMLCNEFLKNESKLDKRRSFWPINAFIADERYLSHVHKNEKKQTVTGAGKHLHRKTHSGTPAVTDWPPQSPDLNIIEAMWDDPDRESQDPKRSLNVQEACRTIFGGYLEKWEESWKVKTVTTNIPAGSNLYKVSLSYKLFSSAFKNV